MNNRPSWDNYFIELCEVVSKRSTCDRKRVGAILVKNKQVIATGYNGSLPGLPHCDDPNKFQQCPNCKTKIADTSNSYFDHCFSCYESLATVEFQIGGHIIKNNHCVRTIHAEVNAITQAAQLGVSTKNATLFCNTYPCLNCFQTAITAGINEIVYRDSYTSESTDFIKKLAKQIPYFVIRQHRE